MKADAFQTVEGSSPGCVMREYLGHRRGLRPGHVHIGVAWELGRANCLLVELTGTEVYRFTKRPGAICFCFWVDDESDPPMWVETRTTEVGKVSCDDSLMKRSSREGLLAVLAERSTAG